MRTIRRIIVHHSAGPDDETIAAIRAFHTAAPPKGRGWSDIGYHLVLRRAPELGGAWTVNAGRALALEGAHDAGQNTDSIGVCICGDYSQAAVPWGAWLVLVGTVAALCKQYGLTSTAVEGHREHEPATTPTACPGFDPAQLRQAVAKALGELAAVDFRPGVPLAA